MVRERVFERLENEVSRLKRQLGTWTDTDNDGVAELQKQHADFQGGDARNVGAVIIDGTPVLTANGKVSTAALPDLAITETNVVADESERLNLDAEEGDVAIQQDAEKSYILVTDDPTQTSNWAELSSTPAQWQEDGSGNLVPVDRETIGDGTTTADHQAVSADSVGITNAGTVLQQNSLFNIQPIVVIERPDDTSSTSFTDVGALTGYVNVSDMPDSMTLYGRYFTLIYNTDSSETITTRPTVNSVSGTKTSLSELALTQEGGDITSRNDTGWVEITSIGQDFNGRSIEAKVSGGTGVHNNARFGIQFAWRVD